MLAKSNAPKISVLIPVYNVESMWNVVLFLFCNQTMQEGVEVIIVNDCTPDCSMELFVNTCAYGGEWNDSSYYRT